MPITKAVVLAGSNKFPYLNSTLPSCVLDCENMLRWYGATFDIKDCPYLLLRNERFTVFNFFNGIARLIQAYKDIRDIAIGFSSHGTVGPVDGQNHAMVVTYGSRWDDIKNSFILDSALAAMAAQFPNVRFWITADICESADLAFKIVGRTAINKFIDPPEHVQDVIDHNGGMSAVRSIMPTLPNVAYVSGTGGQGYYSIDEGNGGAFTKHWTKMLKPVGSAVEIATMLDKAMDPQQQPQPHGGLKNEKWFS